MNGAKIKPPYIVPPMSEIKTGGDDSYNVVSTFSGCGGTCLGFRMAGFTTLWANEFIPAAAEVYRLNHPNVLLDTRSIRDITPASVLSAIGLQAGGVDVLEGSPPCASFSSAGRRSAHWGQAKKYSDTTQRVDDLFWEFARLLDGIQPKVFVAENVQGLVQGVAKGYFKEILAKLKECGYEVECRIIDAQWLGVPQSRKRVFFVGVRQDLPFRPVFPKPMPYRYSIRDVLGAAGVIEAETDISNYSIGKEWDKLRPGESSDKYFNLVRPLLDKPCPTITQSGGVNRGYASVTHPTERRKFSIGELKRLSGFPDDFQLVGTYAQQWERLGRAVPPLVARAFAETIRREILHHVVN